MTDHTRKSKAAASARQLSDHALVHLAGDVARSLYATEKTALVASPSTGDLFCLDADPSDPALARQLGALEGPLCQLLARELALPENREHRETLALYGQIPVNLGAESGLLAVAPSLEMSADLGAERLRSPQRHRLTRRQADAIADLLDALCSRLALHDAESLPINPPWPAGEPAECPSADAIALVRRLAHQAAWFGTFRLELMLGCWVSPDHSPSYDTPQGSAFRFEVEAHTETIEKVCRAVLRLRDVPATDLEAGVDLRLSPSDPGGVAVRLPTLQQAASFYRRYLRSRAGLRLSRMRADGIAALLDQLAAISRLPVRRRS